MQDVSITLPEHEPRQWRSWDLNLWLSDVTAHARLSILGARQQASSVC